MKTPIDYKHIRRLIDGMSDLELVGLRERNAMVRDMYKDNADRMSVIVEIMNEEIENRGLNE